MKYFKYLHIVIFCLLCNEAVSQAKNNIQTRLKTFIPSEKVVMHLNNDLLISGETLYYKILCLDAAKNIRSNVSKIAYVTLKGANNVTLFKHKVKLQDGFGYSAFFIPANIKTGNYKLVGYTQWMRNNTEKPFFQKDIYIINPYLAMSNRLENSNEKDDASIVQIQKNERSGLSNTTSKNIVLETNLNAYKTRSKVTLNIKNLKGASGQGHYSISIRELNTIDLKNEFESDSKKVLKNDTIFYLPEIRGEILSGYVVSKKNTKSVQPNVVVTLSVVGNNPVYKNVVTDENGRFFFNIHENYSTSKCVLQVLDEEKENFDIILDDTAFNYEDTLEFKNLYLNPDIESWLINRSIKSQIENAYSAVKQDVSITPDSIKPFYGKPTISYKLDDYKRFPSVRETFTEVIQGVGVRKSKDDYTLKVYRRDEFENIDFDEYKPLVIVDGLLIQDNAYLVDYSPYKIESVSFFKGVYFNGPSVFDGIIDVRTKTGDFTLPRTIDGLKYFNLDVPQLRKTYYTPNYETNYQDLERIPDYRHQLLWQPNINLNSTSKTIEFYTSDVEGVFEVVLKGYTVNGNEITSKTVFEVKNN